jgi:adenosine deaminase
MTDPNTQAPVDSAVADLVASGHLDADMARALHALPKAELHVHLDGSIRPQTMIELAAQYDVQLPSTDPVELGRLMRADDSRDLEDYLKKFAITLSVMQTPEALERIAYELAEDHALENVRWLEVRFSPWLNTQGGLTMGEVLEAVDRGLARAERDFDIKTGVIVCALRHLDPAISCELAELAVAHRAHRVVAFDLAAGEAGNPAALHADAFHIAAEADLSRTVHAGEAFGPPSIRQALLECDAHRIGHGTRLLEDASLEAYVRDHRVPIEICLTSNVQTRVAPTFAEHPVRRYFDDGIMLTLCTDNRLVSGTTVTREYALAHLHLGFTLDELRQVARMGFEAAFVPWPQKVAMLKGFDAEVEGT